MQADADRPQLYSNSLALTRVGLGSWAPGTNDAGAVPKPSLQAHSQSQPGPERDTPTLCSVETAAASSQGADDAECDKEPQDTCSSISRDDTGSSDHTRDSDRSVSQSKLGTAQEEQQYQSKPAVPVQHSPASAVSDTQHTDAEICGLDRGPTASGADAPHDQPTCRTDWASAFTSKHGAKAGGLGQLGLAPKCKDNKGAGSESWSSGTTPQHSA